MVAWFSRTLSVRVSIILGYNFSARATGLVLVTPKTFLLSSQKHLLLWTEVKKLCDVMRSQMLTMARTSPVRWLNTSAISRGFFRVRLLVHLCTFGCYYRLLMVTYQNSLDPTKLDHSFGLGGLLGCGLLSGRHIVTVGKAILKWLLENKTIFMKNDAIGIKETPHPHDVWQLPLLPLSFTNAFLYWHLKLIPGVYKMVFSIINLVTLNPAGQRITNYFLNQLSYWVFNYFTLMAVSMFLDPDTKV